MSALLQPDLSELIAQRNFFALRTTLKGYPPVEVASFIDRRKHDRD